MNDHPHHDSALIACDGERVVQPILLRRDTMRRLGEQAAYQKITVSQLIERVLTKVVRDDFAQVLEP